ncbi:MAG TPA: hypothetical protein VJI68_01080 [Candidatus Nanoarchaeia archaeon]|nr:hypothetical protein [Candidatus Nanoarchaeia archaeon]
MKKIIILVLAMLLTSVVVNAITLPVVESACFEKYTPNRGYNFVLGDPADQNPNETNNIILRDFSDMCKYSDSPSECYKCIVLARYGIEEKENKTTNILQIVLIVIIAILIILIAYKVIKRKKYNGKKRA